MLAYLWASPNTLLGILVAGPGWIAGGKARLVSGILEVHGPLPRFLLEWFVPLANGASAITLGHVVIGKSAAALEDCRAHEQVHVRQYERWGPFFIPAYFLASLEAWMRHGDPYRDNRFEKQAFAQSIAQKRGVEHD